MKFKSFDPQDLHLRDRHRTLLGAVAPRPIAFVSTLNDDNTPNLSPFSFFNVFGSNPPILVFSPARRGRDNTTKDTFENLMAQKEAVVSIVNHEIVEQMVLSSAEFDKDVNEFEKSGFTQVKADKVKPFLVKESPVNLEVILRDMVNYGEVNGGGNLMICEIVKMHIRESVIGEDGYPDPAKMDHIGRLGGNWYTRAKKGLFELPAPKSPDFIGFDGLPDVILKSSVLSGNDLSQFAKLKDFPPVELSLEIRKRSEVQEIFKTNGRDEKAITKGLHRYAKKLLKEGKIHEAWASCFCIM